MGPLHCTSLLPLGRGLWLTPRTPSFKSLRSLLSSKSCSQSTISSAEIRRIRVCGLPEISDGVRVAEEEEPEEEDGGGRDLDSLPFTDSNIVAACAIGLLTGVGVVLFNNGVHGIRDLFWDGIPSRGASFLREEPIGERWQRVILVPVCGGIIVSLLNKLRSLLEEQKKSGFVLSSLSPFLKAVAASVTLGTGNSLGPEGPSVEIGASIAKGVGSLFSRNSGKSLSLVAAGSAAGISSGFNAAMSGCFFAVESVLWPSAEDSSSSSSSVTNTTSVVILSSVIASVISEIGLGSDPAFTVPEYDFRSPSELPLYLLLGILCGVVSLALSKCTAYALTAADYLHSSTGAPKAVFPAFGGLTAGILALGYPEILYWGFENVDVLLESRDSVVRLPPEILLQLIGAKIVATSLSRASGLVGGYYAPSLFIGAATGMAYGKFLGSAFSGTDPPLQLQIFEVASPQAYGLVGMAATLAGVCQVPLTAVLLLFELTHDYRIVLPLLGAVGLSSLISSAMNKKISLRRRSRQPVKAEGSSDAPVDELCDLESSLCVYESGEESMSEKLTVKEAMRTTYVAVSMDAPLLDAVELMRNGKQPCALIVDEENRLKGLLALEDVSRAAGSRTKKSKAENVSVADFCGTERNGWCTAQAVTPSASIAAAERMMDLQGVNRIPVVSERFDGEIEGRVLGLLDRECIDVARRAQVAKEFLGVSDRSSK